MTELFPNLEPDERRAMEEAAPPEKPRPMLAVLAAETFSDPGWIFERKLDGERILAVLAGSEVRLLSRNGRVVTDTYPELSEALGERWKEVGGGTRPPLVLDGEVVAFSHGVTSFARLQERMKIKDPEEARESGVKVFYYLFDILHLGDYSLKKLPLRTRKQILQTTLSFRDPLRFTAHRNEDGEAFHHEACEKGWEGVMAKKADATYQSTRSRDWLKFKCVNRQEMVIGGYTEPGGSRKGFGALLVGYHEEEGGKLRYAGKVGTGFDDDTLNRLHKLLKSRERKTPPFSTDGGSLPQDGVHWVTPNLVGQFGFTEWTEAGKLRHPRFLGLRRDKDPEEVVREEAI
jgi:DNA ligase D-like protein (predicted ligase)